MSGPLEIARGVLDADRVWLVGGAVRDRLLGRDTGELDLDLAVAGDVRRSARELAAAVGAAVFPLSEAFGAWRVVAPRQAWQVDLVPLMGDTIEYDLSRRDFTVNAVAEPLGGGPPIDPWGGLNDIAARRLRMVSAAAFAEDPLRVLRLARLACELGLAPEPDTVRAARLHAPSIARVAPERVFAELRRIVAAPAVLDGLALMDELDLTARVLPELAGLRGVQQSAYHHLDVYDHTLAVLRELLELERDPSAALGAHGEAVRTLLAEPLADELTRGQALRFGALLHDAAKPQTAARTAEGRITFIGHDHAGAELARAALGRLRASERLRAHVAALSRNHLRLGFLVHERPLSRRLVHGYLRACQPVEVDVTVLSVADRLATRGRKAGEAIAAHLEVAGELLGAALDWRASGPPAPLLRGDELAGALGIERGPDLGRLLAEIEAAQYAGDVRCRDDAVRLARATLDRPAGG